MTIRQIIICDDCGEEIDSFTNRYGDLVQEEGIELNGEHYCPYCTDNNFNYCEGCGEYYPVDDIRFHDGNECFYCNDCYPDFDYRALNGYHESPELIPYGAGWEGRLYGIELEMDDGESRRDCIEDIIDSIGEKVFFQQDGSLSNYGMELITHPMTLDYHQNELGWDKITDIAKGYGFRSHDTTTCGLHIHLNRACLGDTRLTRDLNIAKIIILVEKFWDELVVFSRRDYNSLNQWAGKPDTKIKNTDDTDTIIQKSKDERCNRYKAVNLKNNDTIEFRFFKGTLKHTTIIASLQLIDSMVNYVLSNELEEIFNTNNFMDLINQDYIELNNYIKERGI